MTVQFHPRVLELIASRICHDLVSPVGAIGNGVELMEELGADAGKEAVGLIASSADQAAKRLKVFRLCYGAAGTDKNVGIKDIRDAFQDLIGVGRIQAVFDEQLPVLFSMPPTGFFKCLLNLLILAEECSHGDGTINVTPQDGNKAIQIDITAKNPAFRGEAETALKGDCEADTLDPRTVHAYITGRLAAHFGLHINWHAETEQGMLRFTLGY